MQGDTKQTTVEMTAETMLGDLVRILVDEFKGAPDVWQKMSEDGRDDLIKRVTSQVGDAVREAVQFIAADGREVITAELEQITAKDGIKAVCTLAKHDPNRHALLDSVGKAVLIVVADANQFLGGEIPAADPNQLPLDTPVADGGMAKAA